MLWRLPFGKGPRLWPPTPPTVKGDYPSLQPRFEELEAELLDRFTEHDRSALRAQVVHRRYQLFLAVGVAVSSFLGALQAALEDLRGVGVALSIVGLVTTAVANQQRREAALVRYLRERAKAEELRSLYFHYLSGVGGLTRTDLRKRVAAISEPVPDAPGAAGVGA